MAADPHLDGVGGFLRGLLSTCLGGGGCSSLFGHPQKLKNPKPRLNVLKLETARIKGQVPR